MSADPGPDLALLPRIKAAVYAAGVRRSAATYAWPECHRPNCRSNYHGDMHEFMALVQDAVVDSIYRELAFREVTDPDAALTALIEEEA